MNNAALNYSLNEPSSENTKNESSFKWCTVALSEVVEHKKRLEASVYDVEAKQARATILSGKYPVATLTGMQGLSKAYTCNRFKRIWVKWSNYPIFQPSTIMDIKPDPDGYISEKTHVDIESLRVHDGQILVTCSGTIGKVSYVSNTLNNAIFSHDLLRITCNETEYPGYLYTYLKSITGNKLLVTNSYGAVITHIEAEHLDSIPIPNAPWSLKKEIHELIVRSYKLRDESNDLIDEANKLLVEELQLPPFAELEQKVYGTDSVKHFSVPLSKMNARLDASYHIPIIDEIVRHLRAHAAEVTTIGDPRISSNVILPGRFKRIYVEKDYGKTFIGGKQINELDPSNKKYLSLVHHAKRIADQLTLHEQMTLITCSGTIGKTALVPRHWDGWAASQHIIRIIPATQQLAGFINIFLASDYGRALICRNTYGSVVDEIDDHHVRNIPIPLLKNKAVQDQINALALTANQKRYEAYLLEQKALQIMDDEVIYAK